MISLIPFEAEDFPRFISWVTSAEMLVQFAGPFFSFPVTSDQLIPYINDPKRSAYKIKLTEEGLIIGHCELSYERSIPRLCRILIADKTQRNKGLGQATIHKLLEILFIEHDFTEADLNVYEWNAGAIACYTAIGFTASEAPMKQTAINGKIWNALHMHITKQAWIRRQDR